MKLKKGNKLKNMFNKVDGIEAETNSSEIKSSSISKYFNMKSIKSYMFFILIFVGIFLLYKFYSVVFVKIEGVIKFILFGLGVLAIISPFLIKNLDLISSKDDVINILKKII